jgi:hypothetical protein
MGDIKIWTFELIDTGILLDIVISNTYKEERNYSFNQIDWNAP